MNDHTETTLVSLIQSEAFKIIAFGLQLSLICINGGAWNHCRWDVDNQRKNVGEAKLNDYQMFYPADYINIKWRT